MFIKVVNESLLKGLAPAAVPTTLEQQRGSDALYEKSPSSVSAQDGSVAPE